MLSRYPSGALLFDCSYGSTILGSAMSEVSLFLPRAQVYGLSGMDVSFSGDTDFDSKAMYGLDPYAMSGQQHLHPSFFAVDLERNYFGVRAAADTPMAVEVMPGVNTTTKSQPMVLFRSSNATVKPD